MTHYYHPETHTIVIEGTHRTDVLQCLNLGDRVYMPVWNGNIVIPCTVVEEEWVYSHPEIDSSIWRHKGKDEDGNDYDFLTISSNTETDELGWPIYHHINWSEYQEQDKLKIVNQFVSVDEPIGHSVQEGDEIFLSLEEALQQLIPSRKKGLKQRLLRYRKNTQNFIAGTWGKNKHPGFDPLPLKKVYVRRG